MAMMALPQAVVVAAIMGSAYMSCFGTPVKPYAEFITTLTASCAAL